MFICVVLSVFISRVFLIVITGMCSIYLFPCIIICMCVISGPVPLIIAFKLMGS